MIKSLTEMKKKNKMKMKLIRQIRVKLLSNLIHQKRLAKLMKMVKSQILLRNFSINKIQTKSKIPMSAMVKIRMGRTLIKI
jgi:uncharacterized protein (UPF0128 family)